MCNNPLKRGKCGIDDDLLLILLFHFTEAAHNLVFPSQVVKKEIEYPSSTPVSEAEVAGIKQQLLQSVYEVSVKNWH